MAGPAPNPSRRRRNAPVIDPSTLPASGRKGRAPALPTGYKLAKRGRAWWRWAWKLPQAVKWDVGALYVVARRATLEDDLAALEGGDFRLRDLLGPDQKEVADEIAFVVSRLKALAGSKTSILREMRELDSRLGLTPKAMLDMRWTISGVEPAKVGRGGGVVGGKVARIDEYRDRLG